MNDQSGKFTAIREIWLLLDYLDRSPDNRLMSQFDDARAGLASAPLAVAKPPCHNYRDFLSRLAVIETRAHKKESQETRAEGQSTWTTCRSCDGAATSWRPWRRQLPLTRFGQLASSSRNERVSLSCRAGKHYSVYLVRKSGTIQKEAGTPRLANALASAPNGSQEVPVDSNSGS